MLLAKVDRGDGTVYLEAQPRRARGLLGWIGFVSSDIGDLMIALRCLVGDRPYTLLVIDSDAALMRLEEATGVRPYYLGELERLAFDLVSGQEIPDEITNTTGAGEIVIVVGRTAPEHLVNAGRTDWVAVPSGARGLLIIDPDVESVRAILDAEALETAMACLGAAGVEVEYGTSQTTRE